MSSPSWFISWGGEGSFTAEEIWPDGDAPENPTTEDVINVIHQEGNARSWARNWNCDVESVEVNGKAVF